MPRLFEVLSRMPFSAEVLAIDDGSTDRSFETLREEAASHSQLKVIRLRRNFGQTAAMTAGFDHAAGQVIVALDADLQNDPADIPGLLAKLDEGYDVVSGWRKLRKDAKLRRAFMSRIGSWAISSIFGVRLHDYGCTLKAYRRDIIKGVRLYGEMHRFIPIYARGMGARVTEVPVQHHPRTHGVSKYGLERLVKVILDMIVVKFLDRYFAKPIYVFGGVGLLSMALSCAVLVTAIWFRLTADVSLIQTPLLLLSVLLFLVGTTSILMGLLAEMIVRTYFESQHRPPYTVRESVNL
jgi:glycosyltransferase involved in cell wall biosynthesis